MYFRAGGTILKVVGPALILQKKWWGPTISFTLFPPKSGGARAQPAHTLPPGLVSDIKKDDLKKNPEFQENLAFCD